MARIETKGGIKAVVFGAKTAALMLTAEGWQRYIDGEVIRPQDFKKAWRPDLPYPFTDYFSQ